MQRGLDVGRDAHITWSQGPECTFGIREKIVLIFLRFWKQERWSWQLESRSSMSQVEEKKILT